MNLSAIPRFLELHATLATAGQPTEQQLADIAAAGFAVVINLGLHGDPAYSLRDERASVLGLGMRYVHIPVAFAAPTLADLRQFIEAMAAAGEQKVFVHCRHNKRVPVFIALDRILRQGWPREAALSAMQPAWELDDTWRAFVEQALANLAGPLGRVDQECFAQALRTPPAATPALKRAFARRRSLLRDVE